MKKITFLFSFVLLTTLSFGQTFNGTTGPITDNACPTTDNFTATVSGVGTLATGTLEVLEISFDITHTWDSDVELTLIAPDGTTSLPIVAGAGGSDDNFTGTVVSDDGADFGAGAAPFTGDFAAQGGSFATTFTGISADGDWVLAACDSAGGDTGSVDAWTITFGAPPACPVPTAAAMSNITAVSADLGWNAGGTETLWDVELVDITAGGTATGTPTASGVANPYTFMGLTPLNDYEAYVRSDCGGELSDWVGPIAFQTTATCPAPSAAGITNLSSMSADFGWTAEGTETLWDVELVDITAAGMATGTPTASGVANPYTFMGLTPSNDYAAYVRADCGGEFSDWTGPIAFSTPAPPPANDECVDAIAVACNDVVTGSTVSATNSLGNLAPDVWYSFTGTGALEDVTVSLCNSAYDTLIRVFDACGGAEVVVNDDSCGLQSEATFTSDGTSTYYIMIEGFGSGSGTYELAVTCQANIPPPANDECGAGAEMLTLGTATNGTTVGATQSAGDQPSCDSFGFIADVWYSIPGPASGELKITTTATGTSDKASVEIYDSCAALDANQIAGSCSDDVGGAEVIATGLTAGVTYYVRVWSDGVSTRNNRTEGTFTLLAEDATLSVGTDVFEGFKYFPNPVSGTLSLRAQNTIENVAVYNMLGQEVVRTTPNALTDEVNMTNLSTGAYFVKVTINGATETVRIIKE